LSIQYGQPDKLGPFTLKGIIGAGGFGTVYRASHPAGYDVALKVLAPHVDSEETVRRFEREANIRIDHPNVVKVLDAGRDQGLSYIAFELLEGTPLTTVLDRAPLPAHEVIELALQICAGLSAAHARGIVHRDLKPGNLFVCHDGVLKVLDFGIARASTASGPQLTMAGSVIGTPGYLAPEQAKGELDITPATDLWSLGVILYQALAGSNPFMRATLVATVLAVVLEEPPPLGANGAPLPRGLAEVVHRCLHKDPKQRWESAEALAVALHALDPAGSLVVGVPNELAPSIPVDEQRVVALLLAIDVHDFPKLDQAVREWGGELTPMLGGQAIGVFGGRRYEGDEIVRAVQAAVSARDAAGYVAVASGRAVGTGGGVSGDAVQAVERAVQAHLAGVAVDAGTARRLTDKVPVRAVPGGFFEVPASLRLADSGTFHAVREELPLLDREVELAQLDMAVASAFEEERAIVVWAHGPPGIGKSRLRAELERRLRRRGVPMLTGRAESHRRDAAFHLLANALRSEPSIEPYFLDPTMPLASRQQALEELLAVTLEDSGWARQCLEPIARLLGMQELTPATTMARRSDPQLMADRVRVSIADLLTAMSARGPLALVLDDVQWADDASLQLVDELVGRLGSRPLLVFVGARSELSERLPELFAQREVMRVAPRGLRTKAVATLAEAIARRPVAEAIVEQVATRTGGNPFFVEQIVRELAENKLLDTELESLPIPLDVEGAVQSRLDHLPADEKLLCKRAAVYQGGFTEPALAALELPEAGPSLGALTRRGVLSARALSAESDREYRFKNALMADVAYRMNSEEARRELHRLAAQHLARVPGVEREELARHHELGGEPEPAAAAYLAAALEASRRGDSKSTLRCADRALALGLAGQAVFDLHLVRADALSFLGRRAEQREAIEAALTMANTPHREARVLTEKAGLLAAVGEHDEGLVVADRAIERARQVGDADVLAVALVRRGWILLYSGRVPEASEAIGEAAMRVAELQPETAALVAVWRGQLVTAMGDLGKRKAAYEEAVARFRGIGDLRRAASAECNLADTFNRVGAYEEAEEALRKAVASCQRVGYRLVEGYALANLGYALAGQHRFDEALATFDKAIALADEMRQPRLALAVRLYRARARLERGDTAGLVQEARGIAAEAERRELKALEATAFALTSRVTLALGDPAGALVHADRAMTLRDEIGTMEEDEAEVFLALAEALLAMGEPARAREIVARGASRLEFLAGRIADTDWRARFLVEVPVNRRLIELDGASAG
jgi:tetratricopeptide (TPR) repeat protein